MTAAVPSLRPVTAGDEAFLFTVYASTRAEELAPVPWSDEEKETFLRMQFAAQMADYTARFPSADHSVILIDEKDAGRIWVHRSGAEIRLLDIALLPARRNRGAGTALIRELQEEAAEAGVPLHHSVSVDNTAAIRLYRRLGFHIVADHETYLAMEWTPGATSG